jgi:hypothetical protein
MNIVNKLMDKEEALQNQFDVDALSTSSAAADPVPKLRNRSSEVLAAEGRRASTFNQEDFDAVLDSLCGFREGATHTLREYSQFKRAFSTPVDPQVT